jgi:hypothetical protein
MGCSANNATIYVKLTDIDQRKISQIEVMQSTRDLLKKYPPEIHSGVELVSSVGGNQSNAVSIKRIEKQRLRACRQFFSKEKPSNVRPIILSPHGAISTDER